MKSLDSLSQYLSQRRRGAQAGDDGESGLTLIECLVAIVVLAITASAITPPLVIAVASRIQSQRIEQAIEVAQQEIDRVRATVERGDYTTASLPQSTPTVTDSTVSTFNGPVYGAAKAANTPYTELAPTETRQVDVDADGVADYAVQIYRSPGRVITTLEGEEQPLSFSVAVRVYDIDAVTAAASGNLATQPARAGLTGGRGEREEKPLATLYTNVVRGESNDAYCEYFDYSSTQLGATSRSTPVGCSL